MFYLHSVHSGEEQEAGEPGHGDDAVLAAHVQQGELPVDQVRGQVPVGHLLASVAADARLPRRGS